MTFIFTPRLHSLPLPRYPFPLLPSLHPSPSFFPSFFSFIFHLYSFNPVLLSSSSLISTLSLHSINASQHHDRQPHDFALPYWLRAYIQHNLYQDPWVALSMTSRRSSRLRSHDMSENKVAVWCFSVPDADDDDQDLPILLHDLPDKDTNKLKAKTWTLWRLQRETIQKNDSHHHSATRARYCNAPCSLIHERIHCSNHIYTSNCTIIVHVLSLPGSPPLSLTTFRINLVLAHHYLVRVIALFFCLHFATSISYPALFFLPTIRPPCWHQRITDKFFASGTPITNFLDASVRGKSALPVITADIQGYSRFAKRLSSRVWSSSRDLDLVYCSWTFPTLRHLIRYWGIPHRLVFWTWSRRSNVLSFLFLAFKVFQGRFWSWALLQDSDLLSLRLSRALSTMWSESIGPWVPQTMPGLHCLQLNCHSGPNCPRAVFLLSSSTSALISFVIDRTEH